MKRRTYTKYANIPFQKSCQPLETKIQVIFKLPVIVHSHVKSIFMGWIHGDSKCYKYIVRMQIIKTTTKNRVEVAKIDEEILQTSVI